MKHGRGDTKQIYSYFCIKTELFSLICICKNWTNRESWETRDTLDTRGKRLRNGKKAKTTTGKTEKNGEKWRKTGKNGEKRRKAGIIGKIGKSKLPSMIEADLLFYVKMTPLYGFRVSFYMYM